MRRRPGLLVCAAVTVTLPGVLAILAIMGHEHAASPAQDVAVTALGDETLAGPIPSAPAMTHSAVRNAVAIMQRTSGTPVTVLSDETGIQQAYAMSLLGRAAAASQATSYAGIELTTQTGVGGTVSTISQVWHQGGGPTFIQASGAAAPEASYDPGDSSPAGIFGVTGTLVGLLGKHYVVAYRGAGTVDGRPASVIEAYRFDGSLAARFWLDEQTLVPLQREIFDTSDKLVSDDSFVQVRFGAQAGQPAAVAAAAAAVASEPGPAWVAARSPGSLLTSLAGQGWQLPAALPGGLPLYAAAWSGTGVGQVTDLEYSDGLYVISLFVQQGTLAPSLAGWRPVTLDGQHAYVSGHSVTWAGHGLVYTMIADAPPQTVSAAIAALPRGTAPGVLDRLGRGLARMAHLVDPFQ